MTHQYMEIKIKELEKRIKALEQEPSGDVISRQAVIDAMYELCNTGETLEENPWRDNPHIDAITDAINNLPPVNPQEPKTGHWMIVYRKSIYAHLVCDKCLSNAPYDCRTNYCPNCGARMVGEQEERDME